MSENNKFFIYTEKKRNRLIMVKRAGEFDFNFHSEEYDCYLYNYNAGVAYFDSFNSYSEEYGFKLLDDTRSKEEILMDELLYKKIEFLQMFKVNITITKNKIEKILDHNFTLQYSNKLENNKIINDLIREEGEVLKRDCEIFFDDLMDNVDKTTSMDKLERLYWDTVNNTNMGYFSIAGKWK